MTLLLVGMREAPARWVMCGVAVRSGACGWSGSKEAPDTASAAPPGTGFDVGGRGQPADRHGAEALGCAGLRWAGGPWAVSSHICRSRRAGLCLLAVSASGAPGPPRSSVCLDSDGMKCAVTQGGVGRQRCSC